ncbi:retropepsin-like aspartic protease [Flavobacterium sp. LM4]|uniref:retropepsin-like aspartic protease n=1 Tax=Flavobacterium sp. LM4 TaxID=1938609 RepID=UPI0009926D2A|nr:retropepsin-like aspartic protease [Flavobacterium sp. LM4]OOV16593.1 hypothetical protein BXU10_20800 [Flavobacterium sp. LM4]
MKKNQILVILTLIATFVSCTKKTTNKIVEDKLNFLLEQKNYFQLQDELFKNLNELSDDRILYYNVFINKAFGQWEKSNHEIEILLNKHKQALNDSLTVKLLDVQASNYLFLYEYKKATKIYNDILTTYKKVLDSADLENYKNTKNLFGTFSDVNQQKMHKAKDVTLKSYRNKFNHLMIPVKVDTVNEDFIFDTGANLSTISESQAKKMKLKLFEQIVDIGSSTQKDVQSKLALADSLYVGDILFENVLFIVMPDSQLTFPQINYAIKGIIGFPVINQLGEVYLHKDGKIFIPGVASKKTEQNMFFEGLNPVVRLFSKSDTLLFTFDTGAKNTELSFKYYKDHKLDVEKKGIMQTNQRGGAGGKVEVKEYMLSNFPIQIGQHKTSLDKIPVTLEEYDFNKYFDGNLGQDVFLKFNTLIISFKNMNIDFK